MAATSVTIKLTPELSHAIDAQLRALADVLPEFDKAEQCGIDCQQFRKERDEEIRLLQALKANYT